MMPHARWLVIKDEFTHEGLAVEVSRSFKAQDVLDARPN